MKGDSCGFLHQFDGSRMPVCRSLLKTGKCVELDCPFKHDLEQIKECNMFKLGFCVYGPQCRYRHTRLPGPPPAVETIEGAKPKEFRDLNAVMNEANPGVVPAINPALAKRRMMLTDGRGRGRGRFGGGGGRGGPPLALPSAGGEGGYGGGGGGGGYGQGPPPARRGMPAGVGFGEGGGPV
jgi:cleavage and polyadenylation specificity factor subunit 4